MQSVQIVHVATGELRSGFYQCPSGCPLYEAEGLTQGALPFEVDIMQCATDEDAIARAQQLSRKWSSPVRLYKVPAVNSTSCASLDFWPDMKPIAESPKPK